MRMDTPIFRPTWYHGELSIEQRQYAYDQLGRYREDIVITDYGPKMILTTGAEDNGLVNV